MDDGFGMNHGGVGLQGVRDGACGCGVGCDWSCAVCSGWAAACMYGVVVVVVLGASSMLLLMVVVEYTTRVVTLCACVSFCVEWM